MFEKLLLKAHQLRIKLKKAKAMRQKKMKITKNFKNLEHHRKLTKEQKKEIQDYYISLIGKKVPLYCHEYFYSRTGVFNKEYIPNNFYHCELVPRANIHKAQEVLGDKNMCDYLFPGENIAHSILKRINGYYYFEGKPVSEEDAISACMNLNEVIIKPAKESQGNGVRLFSTKDGITTLKEKTIRQLFIEYGNDFLNQTT